MSSGFILIDSHVARKQNFNLQLLNVSYYKKTKKKLLLPISLLEKKTQQFKNKILFLTQKTVKKGGFGF